MRVERSGIVKPATTVKAVQDGQYFWRVRALSVADRAGAWSATRSVTKDWSSAPELQSPSEAMAVNWPSTPLALRWSAVPGAAKYLVSVGTDPGLSTLVAGSASKPVETEGTAFALPTALPGGTYYWAVTAVDAQGFKGQRSRVGSFSWSWPSGTAAHYADLNDADEAVDPQLSWDAVAGAARYDVEINPSQDFAVGSKVCCTDVITGTSYSPSKMLPNNTYYWRVRPIDPDANAGAWTTGQPFTKAFDAVTTPIRDLRVENSQAVGVAGGSTPDPVVRWTPVQASGYYVVVARDPDFTTVIDVAFTTAAAYASRLRDRPISYADETTHYYWAVVPEGTDGVTTLPPAQDSPQAFDKRSAPPALLAPAADAEVPTQPVFRWTPAEGARNYRLQVATDPDFGDLLEDTTTASTAFTTGLTYPADTALF